MNETEITLTIKENEIPAFLNDSTPSQELRTMLPCTVMLQKFDHDYCGTISPLPYDKMELRSGWSNGDLAFAADGSYFAILYKDEETSQQYGNMVTLGRLRVDPSVMENFDNEISVTINLK